MSVIPTDPKLEQQITGERPEFVMQYASCDDSERSFLNAENLGTGAGLAANVLVRSNVGTVAAQGIIESFAAEGINNEMLEQALTIPALQQWLKEKGVTDLSVEGLRELAETNPEIAKQFELLDLKASNKTKKGTVEAAGGVLGAVIGGLASTITRVPFLFLPGGFLGTKLAESQLSTEVVDEETTNTFGLTLDVGNYLKAGGALDGNILNTIALLKTSPEIQKIYEKNIEVPEEEGGKKLEFALHAYMKEKLAATYPDNSAYELSAEEKAAAQDLKAFLITQKPLETKMTVANGVVDTGELSLKYIREGKMSLVEFIMEPMEEVSAPKIAMLHQQDINAEQLRATRQQMLAQGVVPSHMSASVALPSGLPQDPNQVIARS